MNNNLGFDFLVDREKNTITVHRDFAADVHLIWDAYTKSEILDQWWAPSPWKAKTKEMDFREGGHWIYSMIGPAGEEHFARADYKQIEPQKKFIGSDAFTDSDGIVNKEMPQSMWHVEFAPTGDKTHVVFHIEYPDLAQLEATIQMGFKEGLSHAMEGLDALLPQLKSKVA